MADKVQKFVCRIMQYDKIHELRYVEHRSIQWIADYLGLNFRTVKKYLGMSREEFQSFADKVIQKPFVLEPYRSFIVGRLQEFPETQAAQIHDWLKEHYPDLPPVTPKTVYNYVMKLRMEYRIPKVSVTERQYASVPESEPGMYAQVDFGQKQLRCSNGKYQKVYFMAMLLCKSRYKFTWFQDRPFTSETAVLAHEKAFEFFLGIPRNIIYDQDAVFLYDENIGDYRMTEVFGSYVKSRPFNVIFCRPADPESKGKVENCVKYVKNNFLHNRIFTDIQTLQSEAVAWLNRTGNAMVHGTTCRIPYEEWCNECRALLPYTPVGGHIIDEGHRVNKDHSIKYKGNIYSVPLGIYKGESTRVLLKEENGDLIITSLEGEQITRHIIPEGRGNKVINKNHYRNTSSKIPAVIEQLTGLFDDKDSITTFISHLRSRYPRYLRDQLAVVSECVVRYGQEAADAALAQCMDKRLYSANDFKAIISACSSPKKDELTPVRPLNNDAARALANIVPNQSSIETYEALWN